MVKREAELTRQFNEQMKGGTGTTEVIRVLDAGEYESGLKLIAKLVLRPGCSLGYHTHEAVSYTHLLRRNLYIKQQRSFTCIYMEQK